MPQLSVTTVALIEDKLRPREGLADIISHTAGSHFCRVYSSVEEALQKMGEDLPEVVLYKLDASDLTGIEGARRLKERWPHLVIILFTVLDDSEKTFGYLGAGNPGYLLKNRRLLRLIENGQGALSGPAPVSMESPKSRFKPSGRNSASQRNEYRLTPHELRLLKLATEGHSYKTAAAAVGSAVNTIAFHMKNIYRKLQVHSKTEAVAKALRCRLV